MTPQVFAMIGLSLASTLLGWGTWVTLTLFNHKELLAIQKRELEVMVDVRTLLKKIETKMSAGET